MFDTIYGIAGDGIYVCCGVRQESGYETDNPKSSGGLGKETQSKRWHGGCMRVASMVDMRMAQRSDRCRMRWNKIGLGRAPVSDFERE